MMAELRSKKVQEFQADFDEAVRNKDTKRISQLINKAINTKGDEVGISKLALHYSIATAYGDLTQLNPACDIEKYTEKQINYFRQCLDMIDKDYDDNRILDTDTVTQLNWLKSVIYTNYAIALGRKGRIIPAMEYYNKALLIHADFGMALGNLGVAYQYYANLDYDYEDRIHYLHHFAYQYLNKAIKDDEIFREAKDFFSKHLSYDPEYVKQVLSKPLKISEIPCDNPLEKEYRKWALENRLFISTLNDFPIFEFCFAMDDIQFPNMISHMNKLPEVKGMIGMYNQLKQEYAYARYTYYQAVSGERETHFADKDTFLTHESDYPQYSMRVEQVKAAFRILYSLLDKSAFLINKYFDLGIKPSDVSFRSIWLSEIKGYTYKNTLNRSENVCIRGLYWLHKDFLENNSPNPNAIKISKVRNALEHRYIKVYNDSFTSKPNGEIDSLAEYISISELYNITLELLKEVREVLIYLPLAIHMEVKIENAKLDNGYVPAIDLLPYDDAWKT